MITHVDLMQHLGQRSSSISNKKGGPKPVESPEKPADQNTPPNPEEPAGPSPAVKDESAKPDFSTFFNKKQDLTEEETLNKTIE